MNNVSFTGTYLRPATVYKNSEPVRTAVIELGRNDLRSVQSVANKWDSWLTDIMCARFYQPERHKNARFFAVSTQENDFQKVNPSKVLAMFEVDDKGTRYTMEYLDVNPKYRRNPDSNKKRKGFTKIGDACIKFIREKFANKKETDLYSIDDAKPFYEKIGCKKIKSDSDNRYLII